MGAVICAMAITLAMLAAALVILDAQPTKSSQLKNPYWPYSVETSVKDK